MLIKWNSVGGEKMLFIEKVFEQFHDFWLTIMIDIFFIDIIKFYSYFLGLMMTYDIFSSFLIEKFIFSLLFQRTWNRNFMIFMLRNVLIILLEIIMLLRFCLKLLKLLLSIKFLCCTTKCFRKVSHLVKCAKIG